jgi:hypothetical protein
VAQTTASGYGWRHQRYRKMLAPIVAAGGTACSRCAELIQPGEAWDLDHDDNDRSRYLGPSHVKCNRATAGRRRPRRRREWFGDPGR